MSSADAPAAGGETEGQHEEGLRSQLLELMQSLKRREPLEVTYKRYLMDGAVTNVRPNLPKDKAYKKIGSDLRATVETFMVQTQGKDPFDRIAQRQPLQEEHMRAALTLREAKEHEQKALLDATLSALPKRAGMDAPTRRRHLEEICLGLRQSAPTSAAAGGASSRSRTPTPSSTTTTLSAAQQTEQARQQAALEAQRAQAKAREEARLRREEEDRQRRQLEAANRGNNKRDNTPQGALHKLIFPIFKKLWDTEFPHLGGINPFRIVIDRENCASCGAPDYFDVITTPMNLTYIQHKVDRLEYTTFQQFYQDVELMVSNALLYNSDVNNPYHIAAAELKKKFHKLAKKAIAKVQAARK